MIFTGTLGQLGGGKGGDRQARIGVSLARRLARQPYAMPAPAAVAAATAGAPHGPG
jgi:hypothetical protein